MTIKQRIIAVRRARRHLHAANGYDPDGGHYIAVDAFLDALETDLNKQLQPPDPEWSNVGPVTRGGTPLLDQHLTHNTDGIALFPAFDTAWGLGTSVLAPEDLIVDTKDSHAAPGEAFYATGKSHLRYWIGHIDKNHPLGTRFKKGDVVGKTVSQKTPHGHVGVNAEYYLGKGKQFKYGKDGNGPDYTVGSPTIREQLLALEV